MLDRLDQFSLSSPQAYLESLLKCINLCNKCYKKSQLWNLLGSFRQNHVGNKHVKGSIIVQRNKELRVLHIPSTMVPIMLSCAVRASVSLFQFLPFTVSEDKLLLSLLSLVLGYISSPLLCARYIFDQDAQFFCFSLLGKEL